MKVIKNKRLTGMLGCLLALVLTLSLAMPAMAVPQIPHAFYGSVTVGDGPAPDGTVVSAEIGGVEYARTTTLDGKYGYSPTFKMPGDDPETSGVEGGINGDAIEFYLQGSKVASWAFTNGQVTNLDLKAEVLPDFNIVLSPSSVSVRRPGSALVTVQLAGLGEFSGVVSLSATGQPAGITVQFNPESATVPFNSDMNLDVASSVPTGSHTITVVGSSSVKEHDSTLTLTVTIPAPAAGGGGDEGGGEPTLPSGTTDVRGMVDTGCCFTKSATVNSEDGLCTLNIPKGTVSLTEELACTAKISMLIMDEPPPPPKGAHIIGLAYDFQPSGVTFEPPITLSFNYDPADIPEGIAEEDLVIAYYDEAAGEWVELEGCVVDPVTKTITASVSHFTTFANIWAPPPPPAPAPAAFSVTHLSVKPLEVQPKEAVTITLWVANTGGTEGSYNVALKINGVKEAEKRVTIAAGRSQTVSFTVSRKDAGSYSALVDGLSGSFTVVVPAIVPPPAPVPAPAPAPAPVPAPAPAPTPEPTPAPPAVNWPIIAGIIGGAIVLAVLIFFLVRRRRRAY